MKDLLGKFFDGHAEAADGAVRTKDGLAALPAELAFKEFDVDVDAGAFYARLVAKCPEKGSE